MFSIKYHFIFLLVLAGIFIAGCENSTEPAWYISEDFLPLKVGNTWNYVNLENGEKLSLRIESSYIKDGHEIFVFNHAMFQYTEMFYVGDSLYGNSENYQHLIYDPATDRLDYGFQTEDREVPSGKFRNVYMQRLGVSFGLYHSHYFENYISKGFGLIEKTVNDIPGGKAHWILLNADFN